MDANLRALLALILLFSCWLLVPLVPAWITYLITPGQRIGLKGPLNELTVRAGGAFAAYLILLVLAYPLVIEGGMSVVGSMAVTPVWTIRANVVAIGPNGEQVDMPENVQAMTVSFKPDIHKIGKKHITVRMPYDPDDWPLLTVTIPEYGGAEVDLSRLPGARVDRFKKVVEYDTPIAIRPAIGGGLGIPFAPPPTP